MAKCPYCGGRIQLIPYCPACETTIEPRWLTSKETTYNLSMLLHNLALKGGPSLYRKGYAFERYIVNNLNATGRWYAYRTAGSHGPVDITAIRTVQPIGITWLIQSKLHKKLTLIELKKLIDLSQATWLLPVFAYKERGSSQVHYVNVRNNKELTP